MFDSDEGFYMNGKLCWGYDDGPDYDDYGYDYDSDGGYVGGSGGFCTSSTSHLIGSFVSESSKMPSKVVKPVTEPKDKIVEPTKVLAEVKETNVKKVDIELIKGQDQEETVKSP